MIIHQAILKYVLGPSGPRIVEIGARLGGGFITSHLVPISTGVDLVKASVLMAIGQLPNLQPTHQKAAAIRFLTPSPGKIIGISGFDQAQQVRELHELVINLKVGDYVPNLRDATGRIGHVICEASNVLTAIQSAEKIKKLIQIETVR